MPDTDPKPPVTERETRQKETGAKRIGNINSILKVTEITSQNTRKTVLPK